jgi:hypothetical protein
MTAADEYQREYDRVLGEHRLVMEFGVARCFCRRIDLSQDGFVLYAEHRVHVAQALAADPDVRAAVERGALERAAQAIREFADTRGVNVGDEDDEWWRGYRQAQRECVHDASDAAARIVRDLMPRKDGE